MARMEEHAALFLCSGIARVRRGNFGKVLLRKKNSKKKGGIHGRRR